MNRKEYKLKIKQLKEQYQTVSEAGNYRLLKLALLMVILAIIAAVMYGRISI